ncbi:MAG TPA: peptide ABC transporter substrate-binding protein [Acetivibrio saccincola]|uniref:peptide ABC transporter substrate-binding protein n=1 Tax=Acetivibrio saccincola TaxID=1677857 RepID=UPI002D0B0B30|nr:peptide ABC transporter substrate-binding protein [Acetivibrio saccincola]HOA97218.1 peptide ABC transporter substrate-binding protein [Acetivibrio saccincola]HQD28060.1 peptide ABC transporter substrate-binding protein [Acetivibrio saccincola]
MKKILLKNNILKKAVLIIMLFVINVYITSCNFYMDNIYEDIDNDDEQLGFVVDDIVDMGPVKGGQINLFSTPPDTLNPVLTKNAYIKDYLAFVFESLVELDKKQKPVPLLAENWEVSEDLLVWTFRLRDNVYWHDGTPFTSEDVKFTFDLILNSGDDSIYKGNIENIESYYVENDKIFKIKLFEPDSFTPERLIFPIIKSAAKFTGDMGNAEDLAAGEDELEDNNMEGEEIAAGEGIEVATGIDFKPIGTGPYVFKEYKKDEYILLESNEKWWKGIGEGEKGENLPYISRINIKIFKKNSSVGDAFQSNKVDVVHMSRAAWIRYNGRMDITLKRYPSNEFEFIAFNLSNDILKETEIRKAIAYTVDRTKIINDIMPGEAVASEFPVIPDTWMYDTNVISNEVSLEKARALISESGWEENRNGVLSKRIGWRNVPLELELLVNNDNDTRIKVAEEIKKQLSSVGITVNINKVKWDELNKRVKDGKFDMVFLGCTITPVADISFLYSSKEIEDGFNIAGYSREAVDSYLELILKENDYSRKKAFFTNLRNIINQDVPYLGLYFYNDAALYNKKIKGILNPGTWTKYEDYTRWYLSF